MTKITTVIALLPCFCLFFSLNKLWTLSKFWEFHLRNEIFFESPVYIEIIHDSSTVVKAQCGVWAFNCSVSTRLQWRPSSLPPWGNAPGSFFSFFFVAREHLLHQPAQIFCIFVLKVFLFFFLISSLSLEKQLHHMQKKISSINIYSAVVVSNGCELRCNLVSVYQD